MQAIAAAHQPSAPPRCSPPSSTLPLQLVLPEGSRDPQVAPYAFPLAAPPTVETHLTYLDVMGRPTVVLEMRNYVLEKGQALQVGGRCCRS